MSKTLFDSSRTMKEILLEYPSARRALFAEFHIGGCQSCAFDEEHSLEQVCIQNDLKTEQVCEVILQSHEQEQRLLVEPEQLNAKLQSDNPPVIIDARTREEFEAVPFSAKAKATHLKEETLATLSSANPEAEIIIFDHSGKSVMDHVSWFRGHGLKKTFALKGGIDLYAQKVDQSIPRYRLELD